MSNEEKINILKMRDTKRYLEYIKEVLAKDTEMVDYTYYIPFIYDENMLKEMCEKEGIEMKYSSSYFAEGKYNPYMPLDKLTFSRKRVK